MRNNRLVFVDVTVDGSYNAYPMQIRGGMDEMWLSKTREPDYAPDIIKSTQNESGRVIPLLAFFPSVATTLKA